MATVNYRYVFKSNISGLWTTKETDCFMHLNQCIWYSSQCNINSPGHWLDVKLPTMMLQTWGSCRSLANCLPELCEDYTL